MLMNQYEQMKTISLIANSGIQFYTTRVSINKQDQAFKYFYEWVNPVNKRSSFDAVYRLEEKNQEDESTTVAYFYLRPLVENGWLAPDQPISISLLKKNGISPVAVEGEEQENGKIYKIDLEQAFETIRSFENKWLPIPYFYQRKKQNGEFIFRKLGPLNWSRFKMIPCGENNGNLMYDIVLAFETRTKDKDVLSVVEQKNNEYPVFNDSTAEEMDFGLCKNELLLLDFCSPQFGSSYVHDYLFNLVFPDKTDITQFFDEDIHRYKFITSYLLLIDLLVQTEQFPNVKLHRNKMDEARTVDMVINMGNSKSTVLLVENNDFTSVTPLQMLNLTNPVKEVGETSVLRKTAESFDMQMAFRTEGFGFCGPNKSRQFVYPSFVRLGQEAQELICAASDCSANVDSNYSSISPKHFLSDAKPSVREWKNVVLKGEKQDGTIPEISNLTRYISNNGDLSVGGIGGQANHFSRRSLNTFAFLEIINQANIQINSEEFRSRSGKENELLPRRINNIIVTCPPALLKSERDALLVCAADAATLYEKFFELRDTKIIVTPQVKRGANAKMWFYDEATCAQLVYLYSEVGYKYKGCASEFFKLYQQNKEVPLTIGSVDLGAGTTDMLINEYQFDEAENSIKLTPNPLFFDTFYQGGDNLVKRMIAQFIFDDENSALRKQLGGLSIELYRQFLKDFFGENESSAIDKKLKKNLNTQYWIPLMNYFLDLLSKDSADCSVAYSDVFASCALGDKIIQDFKTNVNVWLQNKGEKSCDIDLSKLEWQYNAKHVSEIVFAEFEPLLKKIATIMHAYSCDVILLTGLPSSLAPVRDIFLKYYAVSPDRLIVLNNFYVGSWYPFAQNTGYITDSKTIVPFGALIAFYAKSEQKFNTLSLNTENLEKELDSAKTVQFVESKKIGTRTNYLMTPLIKQGSLEVKQFPTCINAKQMDLDTYPTKASYCIDVNQTKMIEKIRRQAIANGQMTMSDEEVAAEVEKSMKELQEKMPLNIALERNCMDKDSLITTTITDKNGEELTDNNIEIQIKNIGVESSNWLNSGIFEF